MKGGRERERGREGESGRERERGEGEGERERERHDCMQMSYKSSYKHTCPWVHVYSM